MNKSLSTGIVALFLTVFSSVSIAEKGWRFFAGMEENFVHETTVSILAGGLGPDKKIGDAGSAFGLEVSFNCPLLQPPTNKVRQQVSFLQYKKADSTIQSLQINPHYVVEVSPKLWLGAGPGFGLIRAEVNNRKSNMIALQAGVSAGYSIGKVFIGAEARYQISQGDEVGGVADLGASSWQTVAKLGYNFY